MDPKDRFGQGSFHWAKLWDFMSDNNFPKYLFEYTKEDRKFSIHITKYNIYYHNATVGRFNWEKYQRAPVSSLKEIFFLIKKEYSE